MSIKGLLWSIVCYLRGYHIETDDGTSMVCVLCGKRISGYN